MLKYIFPLIFLVLTSCSVPSISSRERLSLPDPEPLQLEKVEFVIVHEGNAESVFNDLKSKGGDPIVFGLTGSDYKALSLNMEKLKIYLKQLRKLVILYREYYEPVKSPVDKNVPSD